MDASLKLFLIGIAVGTSSLILVNIDSVEELWLDPSSYFIKFLSVIGTTWQLIFMGMVITTLPVVVIVPLKKRFTPKQFFPIPFMAGNGFSFLSFQIIAIIFQAIR